MNITAPKNIDKPNYSDEGVNYEKFSKTLISNEQYRLNPQNTIDYNFAFTTAGGETQTSVTKPDNIQGKNFYCTKILIYRYNGGLAAVGNYTQIADGTSTRVAILEDTASYISHNLDFRVPLLFSKDNTTIIFAYRYAKVANEYYVVNLYGWVE